MLKAILRLIRFPNLVIVALTQYLIYFLVFVAAYKANDIIPSLNLLNCSLLVLSTVFIAAGGYIINDVLDYEIDKINKPDSMIIGVNISPKAAMNLYLISILVGFFISLYIAIVTQNLPLLSLYPIAVILLFLYSKYFKKSILIGNLIVAFFCAFVAGIIWVAERHSFALLVQSKQVAAKHLALILNVYLSFAFLSTLFREIIKDIEDQEGDRIGNCRTLPIAIGTKNAKIVSIVVGLLLFASLFFLDVLLDDYLGLIFLNLTIVLPLFYAFYKIVKAKNSKDFHHISQVAKFIMLTGLILLFLLV